ncbi:oocyte zinc finger protein XlCOF6.1-like [Leptidea sinapis]|uniref:oocyte zinc finger protein XlCOF6.1-like n=1 Tax=Leptidea sinapis TaxID=189913 RepID=UPI00213C483A|nr:oocyte zinc finger protein XlCOF6.1-like [Leptidea sinapis]
MASTVTVKIEPTDFEVDPDKEKIAPVLLHGPEFISVKIEAENGEGTSVDDTLINIKSEPCEIEVKQELVECASDSHFILPDNGPQEPSEVGDVVTEEDFNRNSIESGRYACCECGRKFSTQTTLRTHIILHNKGRLECHICLVRMDTLKHYEDHMNDHINDSKYSCLVCCKKFNNASHLREHMVVHDEDKPYKCDSCPRQFVVRAHFLNHQKSARCKKGGELRCTICDKEFLKIYLLKSHLRKHTDERPFQCATCSMYFKHKSTLIRHIQIHNDIRPFACEFCDKTFTHAGLLKPHMRKHTGERPYPCPKCTKTFAHKHNMLRHLARHEKEKNLQCKICNKVFPRESRLVYHMRSHTNSRPFVCDVCGKKFSHRQNVVRHYEKKHPDKSYTSEQTDASVARNVWLKVQKKLQEAVE